MNNRRGDIFVGRVRDVAADGRGIVEHPEGRIFFVPGVWFGEEVEVQVVEIKGRSGVGACRQVLQASPDRIEPKCPHQGFEAGRCGGCPWQFVDYQAQLSAKKARVDRGFAALEYTGVKPIQASAKIFGFRNRAQLKSDGKRLGFVSEQSHVISSINDCLVLNDTTRGLLARMRESLPNRGWVPAKKARWVSLDIDDSLAEQDFTAEQVAINRRLPFRQANDGQNAYMLDWLRRRLEKLERQMPVLELFCGGGNFTRVLAESGFDNITAAEGVVDACDALRELALPNVNVLEADLFSQGGLKKALLAAGGAEVLVLDPPRDGLKVTEGLFSKKSKLRHVFYISCNLATLLRDVKLFRQHRFKIREVQPLDQFPHTPHIEVMVHLTRV